jgi:hypothetical protein
MASLVKLKSFCKVFSKMAVVVSSMSLWEEVAGSHYFLLHLRSTNCKMASPWLQLGSRFFVRGLAGLL